MFQFELLTKRDWVFVVILAVLIALVLGGGIYWLAMHQSARRCCTNGSAAILCAEHQQLLSGDVGLADGIGVQSDRHPAHQAARFEISAGTSGSD
jgi:hypothetical protein